MGKAGTGADMAELIAESFKPGQADALRSLFTSSGAPRPTIAWSPIDAELRNPLLQRFHRICQGYQDAQGRINVEDINLTDFGGLTEWLMLINIETDPIDFRYAFYGSAIAEAYGRDMTGKSTSDIGGHVSVYFAALYKAVIERREWVFSMHEPPPDVFVSAWKRLIAPLVDNSGQVVRLLALNVPENELRAGLDLMVDPVFVMTADQRVVYANRAARTLFGFPAIHRASQTLDSLTGMCLDNPPTPEDMLTQHRVLDTVQLATRGDIVERLVVTVTAAQHRGQAYYVAIMRLIGT